MAGTALLAGFVPGTQAQAQVWTIGAPAWTGAVSDAWFDPGNWTTGAVPGAGQNVVINTVAPNPAVVDGAPTAALNILGIGVFGGGQGELTILNGGTLSSAGGVIGENTGSVGTVLVTGGGASWTTGALFHVGNLGNGTLTIADGGTVSSGGGSVGHSAGGVGMVTVTGGGSTWTSGSTINVGGAGTGVGGGGTGTVRVEAGGAIDGVQVVIGQFGGSGTVTVTGGSSWTNTSSLLIGGSIAGSTGRLTVESGSTFSNTGAVIGHLTEGEVTVTGPGSIWTNSGGLTIGNAGTATVTIADQGTVQSTGGVLGEGVGSGTVLVTGGSTWTNSGGLTIGQSGTGAITVEDGGEVTSAGTSIFGINGTGIGTATITGTGSTWTSNGNFFIVGQSGTGTLTIGDRGVLNTNFLNANAIIGNAANSLGTVVVTGPGSTWISRLLTVGADGEGILRIENGGVVDITQAPVTEAAQEYLLISHGNTVGGSGLVRVTGTGSQLLLGRGITTVGGQNGSGRLEILGGGVVENRDTNTVFVGNNGSGTALIDGPASAWLIQTGAEPLLVGAGGGTLSFGPPDGTVILTNGGTLTIEAASLTAVPSVVLGQFAGSGRLIIGADSGDPAAAPGFLNASSVVDGFLASGGSSTGGSAVTFNHDATDYVFAAPLVGNITVDFHAGTTILTGNSHTPFAGQNPGYTGAATVHADATAIVDGVFGATSGAGHLHVLGGATLGGSGTLRHVTVASGGTLAPGSSPGILTVTGDLVLNAGSILDFELGAPGTPGVGSDLVEVGGDLTLDGILNIADAGGFGDGLYRLFNYGGGLTDNGLDFGLLPVGFVPADLEVQTATVGQVNLLVGVAAPPGLFSFWDGSDAPDNLAVGGGSGTWSATNTNWTNSTGAANGQYDPNGLLIFAAPGGLVSVDAGGGALPVAGMQFAAGGYVVQGEGLELAAPVTAIRVGDGTAAGAGFTATIASALSGGAALVKQDLGTLVLSGVNTYTGLTTISDGTLALTGTGSIASSAGLTLSGMGVFDVSGVTPGPAAIGTLTGAVGSQLVLGSTDLVVDQDDSSIFAGVITGAGGLEKTGTGTLTLTGANTYGGLTTVSAGALRIGGGSTSGSVAGDILNNASLVFDRSNDFAYAGVLTGSGDLTKLGAGMLTLTGDSSAYGDLVSANAGNLRIASGGTLGASALTVAAGGTLSGLGTVVGDVSILGRLDPGETALGVLTVDGNVSFGTDAVFAVRIAENGDRDALAATTASVAGDVIVTAIDPHTSYVDGQDYVILTTADANGVTGTFNAPTMFNHSAFLTPTLTHNLDNVVLTLAVTSDFTTAARTFNQTQAATGLNDLVQTGDALSVFNEIAGLNPDQARNAFDLSSGEIHASGQHVIDQTFDLFNRLLRGQASAGIGAGGTGGQVFTAPGPAELWPQAWLAPLGGRGVVEADGNAGRLDWWPLGLAGGYEGPVDIASGKAYAGFGLGYLRSHGSVPARLSTTDTDGFHIGAYGGWTDGPWSLAGALGLAVNSISTERRIVFGGINQTANARYWSHTIGFSGEAAYGFDLGTGTKISPLFTLDAGWSGHGGFTETGAGALNLIGAAQSWTRIDTGLGIALQHVVLTETGKVTLDGRLLWEHAFADVVPSQTLALAGSPTGFTINGPAAGRDRVRLGLGVAFEATEDLIIRANYTGLFSASQQNHAASVGVNVKF